MRDKQAPLIADVINSLQWFLITFAVVIVSSFRLSENPAGLYIRLVPTVAAFLIIALMVRLADSKILCSVLPLLCLAGCVLMGQTVVERIIFGVMGAAAIITGMGIRRRARIEGVEYTEMFLWSILFALLAMLTNRLGWDAATWWLNLSEIVYLPLCIAAWCISRSEYAISVFKGRTAQPISVIRKRSRRTAVTAVMLVLIVSLLLPQTNGDSMFVIIAKSAVVVTMLPITLGAMLFSSCSMPEIPWLNSAYTYDKEKQTILGGGNLIPDEFKGTEPSELEELIFTSVSTILLAAVLIWAAVTVIKFLLKVTSNFLEARNEEKAAEVKITDFDTVEKIDRRDIYGDREILGRSNADKVRRHYKRRVRSILGKQVLDIESASPDEISSFCAEKGHDITSLTELYKKARYTEQCTAEDVRAARKL